MNIVVKQSATSNLNISVSGRPSYNIKSKLARSVMPQRLNELEDVELSASVTNKYVLMYDESAKVWRDVNPDEVLIASVTDQTPGYEGIPDPFEQNINLDAGTFQLDGGGF